MTSPILITGIDAVRADETQEVARIEARSNDDPVTLDLHSGILGPLMLSLVQVGQAFQKKNAGRSAMQPVTLTKAVPVVFENGSSGLKLTLESSLQIALILPYESIMTLRACLDDLEAGAEYDASITQ